jgi:nucleoside-diphosphate-sugar epimerase
MPLTLVTGATGFLGSEIVAQLRSRSLPVRTTGRTLRSGKCPPDFHCLDLAHDNLATLVRGVDRVIHVAGLAHQFQGADNDTFHEANVVATQRLAQAAAKAGVERFVLVSSVAVYGAHAEHEVDEQASCRPATPYARSKLAAEERLAEIAGRTSMQAVALRPVTLYGEHDPGNVGRLLEQIDRRRFFWIGQGQNRKSLLHRSDAARACVLASVQPASEPVTCWNVSGSCVTMREVVEHLAAQLGRSIPRWCVPPGLARTLVRSTRWRATIEKWLAEDVYSGQRFARAYQFAPHVDFPEGLTRQVAAYRNA